MAEPQPPKRNIDERIDALTMNLELLHHEVAAQTQNIDKLTTRIDKLAAVVEVDGDNIRRLANIAASHEHRIESIEGQQGQ